MREEERPQGFPLLVVMPLNELKLWGTIGFVVGRRVGLLALVSERRGFVRELSASVMALVGHEVLGLEMTVPAAAVAVG